MIPESFREWRDCIENKCKILLSAQFIDDRLSVYSNENSTETIKFKGLYGEEHLQNIINWLETAKNS